MCIRDRHWVCDRKGSSRLESKNQKKIVGFHTLGCKVNQSETEAMTALFLNRGYRLGEFEEYCDVYVINTRCV